MSSDFEYGFDFGAAERQFRDSDPFGSDADTLRRHLERRLEVFAAMDNPKLVRRFQEAYRTGRVPEDIGFYLVARTLEGIAENMDDSPAMRDLAQRMTAIERAHGLEDEEEWLAGEAPPEYERLSDQYDELMHACVVQVMRDHGEHAIAEMYIHRREEFDRRISVGRRAYFDSPPPDTAE